MEEMDQRLSEKENEIVIERERERGCRHIISIYLIAV